MKRVVLLLLIVSVAFGAFANGGSESAGMSDEVTIGVSMPTLQEERWKKDEAMIKNKLMELGVKEENILIQSADGDEQKQVSQCENLITQGIDALIVIPQNGDAMAPVVASAHDAGVKVVSVDRIINNADLDFYVTFDAYYIGVRQAEYMIEVANSGNWIMIGGAPTDPNAALIRQGQLSIIQPYIDNGSINVVLDQNANYWSPADALVIAEAGLTKANNDIDVIFASNDGTAGAAIEALTEQGLAGKVPVPGLDADLAACQRVVLGTQTMTLYRKLYMQADYAAQAAYALATGMDVEELIGVKVETKNNGFADVPSILLKDLDVMFAVDADNMKTVVDDGWLTADAIYGPLDESYWPEWYKATK